MIINSNPLTTIYIKIWDIFCPKTPLDNFLIVEHFQQLNFIILEIAKN